VAPSDTTRPRNGGNPRCCPTSPKTRTGSLTLYIQNNPPTADQQPSWLPSPPGPFTIFLLTIFMRLYWPKEDALNGTWQAPQLTKVG